MTGERHAASRYRENWQDEVDSAAEYRAMAAAEPDARLAKVYANLAAMEDTHVAFWEQRLRDAGASVPPRRASWRSRVLAAIARRLGPDLVLATIAAKEEADQNVYVKQPETTGTRMSGQERWHAKVLSQLVTSQPRGLEGSFLARLEGRHRSVGGNALRAAVLGANDGLCSNLSLVMGVAGASVDSHGLLITGVAGLLAGACSMALGEWVSVTSSRELAQREVRIEAGELAEDPEGEGDELKLIYEAKGLSPSEADAMVKHLLADPRRAIDTLAREELGIDPTQLGGSAWEAALASFVLFAMGALVPILPFLVARGNLAVVASAIVSGLGLFGIGAAITIFTGTPVWRSGGRQLLLGLAAAAVTFGLGRLIGLALTG
ncbi:MAG TPA: VIT1/CCC1 transporter family protein [Candidatus Binatia bacterium]|nr:VIT1/CCC1 transporter family protein [Candidatus Binatia bacterium]